MNHIIVIVWNPSLIQNEEIDFLVGELKMSTEILDLGCRIHFVQTKDSAAPDIRIWDLTNIQNGEPIPPEVIEKLKETVNARTV